MAWMWTAGSARESEAIQRWRRSDHRIRWEAQGKSWARSKWEVDPSAWTRALAALRPCRRPSAS
jgi:hypothetical protein